MTSGGACWVTECDGTLRELIDGSSYCTTCDRITIRNHGINELALDHYDDTIEELADAPFPEVRKEFMAGADLYLHEPLGFPDEKSYSRFTAVFMLYVARLTMDTQCRLDKVEADMETIRADLYNLQNDVAPQ